MIIILLLLSGNFLFGQTEEEVHRWKKIDDPSGKQIWFDASSLDTVKGDKFDVWILEVYKPPIKFAGLEGEVYRSKTLYAINLTSVKYGIKKIRYYDVKNKELYSFNYDTPPPPTDELRYPYPIMENSPVHLVIKEVFGNK